MVSIIPSETIPKPDELSNRVARFNPKICDGKFHHVEREEWIRGIEKIFTVIEVPEEEKVNIWTFYLAGEIDIW